MSRSSAVLPLALGLAALVNACNCDPDVGGIPGAISGRVCHPDTGIGLDGAVLTLEGPSDRESIADADGEYLFERVLPGKFTLTATLDDIVRTFEVDVAARETTIVDDTACRDDPLPGDVGNLDGQICNRHTGRLVTDGEVVLQLADGELMLAQTDATGSFSLNGVPAGEHIVTITGEGFQRAFLVDIPVGGTFTLDLGEDCDPVDATEGGIVGSFCDPATGGNLVGADVLVQPTAGGESIRELTDTNGFFEVNGLAPGLYRVDVTSGSFSFTEPQIEVRVGQLTPVTDPSSCGNRPEFGRIEGQICDEAAGGRFVGTVELISGVTVVEDTASDAEGRFAFNAIEPGTYSVRAFRDGYERLFPGVVVSPFQTTFIQEVNCPEPEDVCTELVNNPQETSDGRILLVVDKSGSMDQNDLAGERKWDIMRSALKNVTQSLNSSVEFGLVLYPSASNVCAAGQSFHNVAPNNAAAIGNTLDQVSPSGGTPTAPTLAIAKGIAQQVLNAAPDRPLAVVLATDGGPNCNLTDFPEESATCRCTDAPNQGQCANFNCLDDVNTIDEVASIKALGINTYVVGVTGVSSFADVLNNMAVVAGTALPGAEKYYAADNEAALQGALEAITQRVLTCRVQTNLDLNAVNSVSVRVGSLVLSRDTSRANGWDILDDGRSIELFGAACDVATSSADNVIVTTCVSP